MRPWPQVFRVSHESRGHPLCGARTLPRAAEEDRNFPRPRGTRCGYWFRQRSQAPGARREEPPPELYRRMGKGHRGTPPEGAAVLAVSAQLMGATQPLKAKCGQTKGRNASRAAKPAFSLWDALLGDPTLRRAAFNDTPPLCNRLIKPDAMRMLRT